MASSLTTIDISGATVISQNAFIYCESLSQISFSDKITEIADNAFAYSAITTITFPKTIKTIGNGAFKYTQLSTITFPDSVTRNNLTIEEQAFIGTQVESLNIPKYVNFDNDYYTTTGFFSESYNLKTIETSLTAIPKEFAMNCFSLTSVVASNCVSIGDYAFFHCKSLETLTISTNLNSIGNSAFAYCQKLSYTLPSTTLTLGDYAFIYCENIHLSEVNSQWTLGKYVFVGCEGITQVRVNTSLNTNNIGCFQGCINIKSVQVDTNFIPTYFFANCTSLTSVTFTPAAEIIDRYSFINTGPIDNIDTTNIYDYDYAFVNSQVKSVTVVKLRTAACTFAHCDSLTKVTIGEKCNNFNPSILINCSNAQIEIAPTNPYYKLEGHFLLKDSTLVALLPTLTDKKYTLDPRVTIISTAAFSMNKNVETLVINNANLEIGWYAFQYATSLKKLEIKSMKLKDIHPYQFISAFSLEEIIFPDKSLVSIGDYFFYNCYNLKTIKLPSTLRDIGEYCFANCVSLEEVDLSMVDFIPYRTFFNCTSLTSVKVSQNLKMVGNSAFCNTNIKSFTVPDSCVILEPMAFAYTNNLKKLKIGKGVKSIPSKLVYFSKVTNLEISSEVVNIDPLAFNNAPYVWVSFDGTNPRFTSSFHMIIEKGSGRLIASFGALLYDYQLPDDVEFIPPDTLYNNVEVVNAPSGIFYKEPSATILRIPENVRIFDANDVLGVYVACSDGKYFLSRYDGESVESVGGDKYANVQLFGNSVTRESCNTVAKRIPDMYKWYHTIGKFSDPVRRNLIIALVFFIIFIIAIIVLYFVYPSWHFMPKLCGKKSMSTGNMESYGGGGSSTTTTTSDADKGSYKRTKSKPRSNTNADTDEYDGIAPRQTRVDRPRQE